MEELDEHRIETIKGNLAGKTSDEIRQILEQRDRDTWSLEAFTTAEELLQERARGVAQETPKRRDVTEHVVLEPIVAPVLVWVFRALALSAAIWGLIELYDQFTFTALMIYVAAVAVPLGLSEALRLCLLIEKNTRPQASSVRTTSKEDGGLDSEDRA